MENVNILYLRFDKHSKMPICQKNHKKQYLNIMAGPLYTDGDEVKRKSFFHRYKRKLIKNFGVKNLKIATVFTICCIISTLLFFFGNSVLDPSYRIKRLERERMDLDQQLFFDRFMKLSVSEQKVMNKHLLQENFIMNKPNDRLLYLAHSIVNEFKGLEVEDQDVLMYGEPSNGDNSEAYKTNFVSKVLKLLISKEPLLTKPVTKKLKCSLPKDLSILSSEENDLLQLGNLASCINSDDVINKVKNNNLHGQYVHQVKNLVMNADLLKLFGNDLSNGIVIPAGGEKTINAMGVVSILRELGSNSFIEVYIPPRFFDSDFERCELLLEQSDPKHKSKCVTIPIDAKLNELLFFEDNKLEVFTDREDIDDSYALLAASTKKTLLINPNYLPIVNPDYLFNFDKFQDAGMVLWPREQIRSTSPVFYELVGQQPNLQRRVSHGLNDITNNKFFLAEPDTPLSDLENSLPAKTVDSNVILVDKSKHLNTLLVALYYKVFADKWYKALLEMKSIVETTINHEAYSAALYVTKNPYNMVSTLPNTIAKNVAEALFDPIKSGETHDYAAMRMGTMSNIEIQMSSLEFYSKFYQSDTMDRKPVFLKTLTQALGNPYLDFKSNKLNRYITDPDFKKYFDIEKKLSESYYKILCQNKEVKSTLKADEFCVFQDKKITYLKKN